MVDYKNGNIEFGKAEDCVNALLESFYLGQCDIATVLRYGKDIEEDIDRLEKIQLRDIPEEEEDALYEHIDNLKYANGDIDAAVNSFFDMANLYGGLSAWEICCKLGEDMTDAKELYAICSKLYDIR